MLPVCTRDDVWYLISVNTELYEITIHDSEMLREHPFVSMFISFLEMEWNSATRIPSKFVIEKWTVIYDVVSMQ